MPTSRQEAPRKRALGDGFLADVGSVLTSNIFILVIGFASSVILARTLGPSGRGVLAAILVVPTLVASFATLGMKQSAVYLIGRKLASIDDVVHTLLLVSLGTGLVAVAVTGSVYLLQGTFQYGFAAAGLALAALPLTLLADYTRGVALGSGTIREYNRINYLIAPLNLSGIIVFVWLLDFGVAGAALAFFLSAALVGAYSLRYLARFADLRIRWIRGLPRRMVGLGVAYSAAAFALSLNYKVDILVLEHLVSPAQVGLYALAASFAELVWKVPSQMAPVLFSRSARSDDPTAFSLEVGRLARVSLWFCVVVGAVGVLLAPILIPLIYGDAFAGAVPVYQMLIPGICFAIVYKLLHTDLAGRGRPWISMSIFLPAAVLNVLLNLLWIPRLGIIGAALASTVSYIAGALAFAVVFSRLCGIPVHAILLPTRADFRTAANAIARLRARRGQRPAGR